MTGTSAQYDSAAHSYVHIVDGSIDNFGGSNNYGYSSSAGLQCVTVDLEENYNLDEIAVWPYYWIGGTRPYTNHSLYVSSDNTNWVTLIDNASGTLPPEGIRISAWD